MRGDTADPLVIAKLKDAVVRHVEQHGEHAQRGADDESVWPHAEQSGLNRACRDPA
jgi:hypothetical protein